MTNCPSGATPSVGLLIHPDILSKVNCAQTSQSALCNPGARSGPRQAGADVLSFEHFSGARERGRMGG